MEINNAKLRNKPRIRIKTEIGRHRKDEEDPEAPEAVAAVEKEKGTGRTKRILRQLQLLKRRRAPEGRRGS
jgi:hypothetical protein